MTRIEFVAGGRALADYRRANDTARQTAALFSAGRDDSPALVAHLIEENKKLGRRVRELEGTTSAFEAEQILKASSSNAQGVRVVAQAFPDRDANSLQQLARALIAYPQTVALLGARDGETAGLVFARSPDAPGDMNALMRKACEMIDGRGGGKADMAQGGGKNIERLDQAIDVMARTLN